MQSLPSFDDINDDAEEAGVGGASYVPYQYREDKSEEGTLRWLNDNFDYCYQESKSRLMTYRRINVRSKNQDPNSSGMLRSKTRDNDGEVSDKPTVRTNFSLEYLDQKVASASKAKQNPKFIPLNDTEQDDVNNAESCNKLVKYRMQEIDIHSLMREQDRKTFKYGHSFAKVYWDKCAGPVHPKYLAVLARDGKVPELGEDGKPTGKKISRYSAKVGDVGVKILDSDCFFPERKKKKFELLDYAEDVEFVNIHELSARYPKAKIKKEEYLWLDVDSRGYNQDDQVMVHNFHHRPTKELEYGEVVIYCESGILERITDPEEIKKYMPDEQLPYVQDTDIDSDDSFWAYPFLMNIEQLNNLYDLIQSGIARNVGVASHPKLMVYKGSISLKQADNNYGVMQWQGTHKPEWLQHNYINRGEFEIQDRIIQRMDKQAKVYDISKGQVPAGITATSGMRLLDDQEIQANSEAISKRRKRINAIYWKVMKFMDKNYKPDDNRMSRILGPDNSYLIESFEKYDFGKMYSVEQENISALADDRAGRVSDIVDLNAANQKEPTFGRKEIIKLLHLGLEDAFTEETSYAPTTAKTCLEMLKNGKDAPKPESTDDLIEMYGVFSRFVESLTYKTKIKEGARKKIQAYIKGMEYAMAEKAKLNATFAMNLKLISKYPMFYTPGAEITAVPTGAPPVPGAPGPKPTPDLKGMADKTQLPTDKTMEGEQV